ncbi:putative YccA/Bax inhibitor family protein [Microbacteriaceae bacterium SG_E_30_P1]|uniref:YccA/Bax inhibitor family protein n=1 Tax=Antiquaquibacter oligotrophicus TaxID=2880260 RepID=A0ABT6KJK4_9MICO|nr:Bax inhibitor-1/YccA family protein [Antiquaquibacter oligotrophicus]MDH6179974.1 putative YccA/Bax inhibitor family protein [Antiquaquibacter oligotrophicus]UDF14269.1 Bax inhibitor-1/YccA family protein [Antiquaquibacter oligotrophicus]
MAFNNPAFRNEAFTSQGAVAAAQDISAQQLDEIYNRPSAEPQGEVMTVENTIQKTVFSFAVLLVGAVVGWFTAEAVPFLWIGAGLVGFVLALVNIFKKEPSPALILAYSAVQGVFVGGISAFYNAAFDGVVLQAVIATFVVVGVTLALFASGKIRASKRATKIFLIAMIGYALFSVVNLFIMLFGGAGGNPWGLRGDFTIAGIPLGLILGVLVVILAAYSLVLDFDFIQKGARNKAPAKYGWTGAFGIMVTVIWLYLELLRMFAIARN